MKKILVFIFAIMLLAQIGLMGQTKGDIKRDTRYNPVTGYYDSADDSIHSVGPKYPLPTTDLQATGFYGATLITGTTVVTGNFHAIQVLADCVIDSLVSTKLTGDPHSLALDAGTVILLNGITRIKLTSGKVWAYKSE